MTEMKVRDIKTTAYVLRRTNYKEADRILNLITPVGKITAIAKGVRKQKSKLAGGVEMLTLTQVSLHFGKSDFATLTGAKMIRFYDQILKDLERMELAYALLKEINLAASGVDSPEFFEILDKCLVALNENESTWLVRVWFDFNLARASGEQLNLYTDMNGEKLKENELYNWNDREMVFEINSCGEYDANAIKLLRLVWAADLQVVRRVKDIDNYALLILKITQAIKKVVK